MRILITTMLPDLIDSSGLDTYSGFEDLNFFVKRVAIPHATMILVREDYNCGRKDANHLVLISEPFGSHEYPLIANCPVLDRLKAEWMMRSS